MTIAPEQIQTAERTEKTKILDVKDGSTLGRHVLGGDYVPDVFAVGDEDLFDNNLIRAEKNIYGLSSDVLFVDKNITSQNVEGLPAQKVANRLRSDSEKGANGAVVVNAADGFAYRSEGGSRVLSVNENGATILEGTGVHKAEENESLLIVDNIVAEMVTAAPDRYNGQAIVDALDDTGVPYVIIQPQKELIDHQRENAATRYKQKVKQRASRPARKAEAIVTPVVEQPKRGFEDADMADLPMTASAVDLPGETTAAEAAPYVEIEQGQQVRVRRTNGDMEDNWTVLGFNTSKDGKNEQLAYVQSTNEEGQPITKWVSLKDLQNWQGESAKAVPTPEAVQEVSAKPRPPKHEFKVTDSRKWNRDVLNQPLEVSRHDMLVDGESPDLNTEQLNDPAIAAAEVKLVHIREQIDAAIADGKKSQKQLPELWHDYKAQEARLKSLKDGTPYVEPLRVESGPLTLKERAQNMYARAGAEFSSRMFMAKERLPKPRRYEDESDEKYEKRVRRRRGLLLGAAALATAAAATYLNYQNEIDVDGIRPVGTPEVDPPVAAPVMEPSPLEAAIDVVQTSGGDIISPSEGLDQTFLDMNITDPNQWANLRSNPAMINELKQIGFVYDMPNGQPGILMPENGKMPEEAARIILKYHLKS